MAAAVEHVAAALVNPRPGRVAPVDRRHQRGRAIDHRRVDDLAASRPAGLEHRRHHPEREIERAAAEIADQVKRRNRRAAGRADRVQRAAQRDVVGVVARGAGERAVLAPPGHAAIDQLRVAFETSLRPDAEPLGDTGAKSFDQGVRALDHPEHHPGAVGMAEVDRGRAPVA